MTVDEAKCEGYVVKFVFINFYSPETELTLEF